MEENTNADITVDITVDECQELKNIKYKTMLLNGAPLHETKSSNDISNLEKFLEDEKINNSNEPWCKLNKTIKTKKLIEYVEIYKKDKNLDENENKLKAFIRRYESAEIDDNEKTTLRELATLRHGQNLHENFVRYFGMEEENNFRYFMFIFFL